ncbi:MAG: GC-type dockerin domain-anchored protein [Phycisphaerales bacterium JB039]
MKRIAIAALLCAGAAHADESVSIDLAGAQIKDGVSVFRSSAPDAIDPATSYRYTIDGMVQGSGIGLGALFPAPTPLADALEALQPGASDFLTGLVCNPAGTHPVQLVDETFEGQTEIIGITVDFAATFKADIDAAGVASFSITNVNLEPSFLVGSLTFTSGAAVIERVACRADVNDDGLLDFFDFLEFQNLFALGDRAADFNCDGALDFFDFLEFQNQFAAGCP